MKIANAASRVVDSRGLSEESDFQILATAQSFRILSSGLYSDKISAVLREVGCNAMDSHIAAGEATRPIEIKLPTLLSSEFYIKDFGLGLSHDEIKSLYTTYFSSNKGQSNDLTGAFGLGSKSPFSYTDSFSVTTAQNGVQRTYSAYIGKSGSPVIALLKEEPTSKDWPHGVMVSFPVKPSDINEFAAKANQVYQWFAVKPIYPSSSVSAYTDPEKRFEGSNFFFLKYISSSSMPGYRRVTYQEPSTRSRVLMGNVAYPLDVKRLGSDNKVVNALIQASIHLRMPLGSVMPTASREELEYDERTRRNIGTALVKAGMELGQQIADQVLLAAPSEWERHRRAIALIDSLPSGIYDALPTMLELLRIYGTDKAKVIDCCTQRQKKFDPWIGGIVPKADTVASDAEKTQHYYVWIVEQTRAKNRRRRSYAEKISRSAVIQGKTKLSKFSEEACIAYSALPQVYYVDDINGYARIRELFTEKTDPIVMVAADCDEGKPGLKAYAQRVAEALGGLPVKAVSSLPQLQRDPKVAREQSAQPYLSKKKKEQLYAKEFVSFVDTSSDELIVTSTAFGAVPDNAHYYLPAPSSRNPISYAIPGAKFSVELTNEKIMLIVHALNILKVLGAPIPDIGGYIIPVQAQGRKFKLVENGWKNLTEVISEVMKNPAVAKAIESKLSKEPDLGLSAKGCSCAADQGYLGCLCHFAYENKEFKEWLFRELARLPTLKAVVEPLWDANVPSIRNKTAMAAVQVLMDILHEPPSGLAFIRQNIHEYFQHSLRRFPRLMFLDKDNIEDSWNHKTSSKHYVDVLKFVFEAGT